MEMADVPLTVGAVVDTAITCFVMSLLVTLFISADTRRALKAGTLEITRPSPQAGRLLRRLPRRSWQLGLFFGLAVAAIVTPCLAGLFSALGVAAFSFPAFALLKAVYTPPVAYAVARWAILRQLASSVA